MRKAGFLLSGLLLVGCGSEPAARQPDQASPASQADVKPKASVELTSKERGCPFTKTQGWYAQIERNRFSVDGQVDFMMAGYKPALTRRSSAAGGVAAFDLALAAEPGGAVQPAAHYEEPLSTAYKRVTIYCGGKEVASFEPLDQRL